MNPVSGDIAPTASISRSAVSRSPSGTFGRLWASPRSHAIGCTPCTRRVLPGSTSGTAGGTARPKWSAASPTDPLRRLQLLAKLDPDDGVLEPGQPQGIG